MSKIAGSRGFRALSKSVNTLVFRQMSNALGICCFRVRKRVYNVRVLCYNAGMAKDLDFDRPPDRKPDRSVWIVLSVMIVLCIVVGVLSSVLTAYFMRRGELPVTIDTENVHQALEGVVSARKNNVVEIVSNGTVNGSGVIIEYDSSKFHILTNAHVVGEGTLDVKVRFAGDDEAYTATKLGYSSFYDVSVISVTCTDKSFPNLDDGEHFVRDLDYKEGEYVVAIGNAMGMGVASYEGIISRSSELIKYNDKTVPVLRTTAAVNEGMSGGALFDVKGRLVGLNTYRMNESNNGRPVESTGFVIPVSVAYPIYRAIVAYGDGGEIGLAPIDYNRDPQSAVGMLTLSAFGITCSYRNGELKVLFSNNSAISVGDVITAIGGYTVTTDICRTAGELLCYRSGGSGKQLGFSLRRGGGTTSAAIEGYYAFAL